MGRGGGGAAPPIGGEGGRRRLRGVRNREGDKSGGWNRETSRKEGNDKGGR